MIVGLSAITSSPAEQPRAQSRVATRWGAPEAAFAGLLALGALLVLVETRGLSFFADEWDFVVDRRGFSAHVLLSPHGPHLVFVPILIYKVLLGVFGASSYLAFRVLAAFDIVLLGFVLGLISRHYWGKWWGLAPVLLLVTLGPGGISLLWPFQTGYAISVAAGLITLVALTRTGRAADAIACGALIVSLASGSQGIGFIIGAALMLVLRGDWRRRWWVVGIPAALYALWYLKYGRQASESELSLWTTSLVYCMQALSVTIAGVLGLSSVSSVTGLLDPTFGVPLALAALARSSSGFRAAGGLHRCSGRWQRHRRAVVRRFAVEHACDRAPAT